MAFLKKYVWWIVGLIVAYIIYRIASNRIGSDKGDNSGATNTPGGGIVLVPFIYDPSKVDRKKMFGVGTKNSHEVAYLQTWLNQWYKSGLTVDGDWGARTTIAVLANIPAINQAGTSLDTLKI